MYDLGPFETSMRIQNKHLAVQHSSVKSFDLHDVYVHNVQALCQNE